MLASCALLATLYFAYWADGNFLGPRFVYALAPALALWTVRFPSLVRDRVHAALRPAAATFVFRATAFGLAVSAVIAAAADIPLRAHEYHNNFQTERWATPEIAAQSGVHDAVVFVREGWEEQLVARLWALGVSRPHVETLYRAVDVCRLDSATTALEAVAPAVYRRVPLLWIHTRSSRHCSQILRASRDGDSDRARTRTSRRGTLIHRTVCVVSKRQQRGSRRSRRSWRSGVRRTVTSTSATCTRETPCCWPNILIGRSSYCGRRRLRRAQCRRFLRCRGIPLQRNGRPKPRNGDRGELEIWSQQSSSTGDAILLPLITALQPHAIQVLTDGV